MISEHVNRIETFPENGDQRPRLIRGRIRYAAQPSNHTKATRSRIRRLPIGPNGYRA
jgi:hypothetical protein